MFAFVQDRFVALPDARISITDLSVQRGYGVFDFLRVKNRKPLYVEEHLSRFFHSASTLHLEPPYTKEEIRSFITDIIRRNDIRDSGIRLTLTGGVAPDGFTILSPTLLIAEQRFTPPTEDSLTRGIRLMSYAHQRQIPAAKTIDYLTAIWMQPKLQQTGADDLLYHCNGVISECPRANIFIITEDGVLVTPVHQILKGITRHKVITLAKTVMPVEERSVTLDELQRAAEVFITSTTKTILPVISVDVYDFPPGKITRQLRELLLAAQAEAMHSTPAY